MPRRWGRASDTKGSDIPAPAIQDVQPQKEVPQQIDKEQGILLRSSVKSSAKQKCIFLERGQSHEALVSSTDKLAIPSLPPATLEYRKHLRALWMRDQGYSKTDCARELDRPLGWITQCWQTNVEKVHRPREVAKYIAAYETRMIQHGVEPFKEPSLHRSFVQDSVGLYEEMAASFPWQQAVLRKRNYETGEVTITNIASARQDCTFPTLRTGLARLDRALERARAEFGIRDPGAYLMCNWYPDGNTNIAPHQHDFRSVTFSFGASRVFLLDSQPILLADGDLLVFGTQRHSVPRMPQVQGGRISVSIFFYPERTHADGSFAIRLDPSVADAAFADGNLAEIIAHSAAGLVSQVPLDLGGRGVGRYQDDGVWDDNDVMTEERLMAIAMEVSLLEQ